jgi:LL-diaminopimelate aminotransferase
VEIIDFGVGEPDRMAPSVIVEALAREAADPVNRGYTDNGTAELKQAAARYMAAEYGVEGIDPETEVLHTIGAKSALAMLPSAFINPGDVCLQTVPGYPVMATHSKWYGGEVFPLPLRAANDFLPRLDEIPNEIAARAKLLYLNYPNNPTGAVATEAFYREAIAFARAHGVLVISDLAYGPLTHEGAPLSILSIPGARDVALEIHSFSKAYNMTGWRLAFTVGAADLLAPLASVKDNYDSGQFRAIQKAGVVALEHPELSRDIRARYARRLTRLTATLREAGFDAVSPAGSFFLYTKAPASAVDPVTGKRHAFDDAEAAGEHLITKASIVTVPWDDAGAYLRFSVTFEAKDEAEEIRIIEETGRRLKALALSFD